MTPAEAAVLLAKVSANDNREVTEAGARAWAEALPDVALTDALAYLPKFYREATRDGKNWIYPGDVLNGVVGMHRNARADLANSARQAVLDAASEGEFPESYAQAQKAQRDAINEYNREHAIPQLGNSCTGSNEPGQPGSNYPAVRWADMFGIAPDFDGPAASDGPR